LIAGENYTDIVEEYKLVTFPSLKLEAVNETPEVEDEAGLFEE
jgi:hypothetical protein